MDYRDLPKEKRWISKNIDIYYGGDIDEYYEQITWLAGSLESQVKRVYGLNSVNIDVQIALRSLKKHLSLAETLIEQIIEKVSDDVVNDKTNILDIPDIRERVNGLLYSMESAGFDSKELAVKDALEGISEKFK